MALGKILVVDDDKNICELLRLYLEKEGYSVILAHDGEEALLKFETLHPELILLDIMLPGLDGWQVCREIRKKSQVPIIMLTAKGETFDKVLGLELGADDYVVKPFDAKEIVARIKDAGKVAIVHVDMIQGLSTKRVAVDFIAHNTRADGIISTKNTLVEHAKEMGLYAIQRTFVVDSIALDTLKKQIEMFRPDAVEIMPGVMPKILKIMREYTDIPLIAGGLLSDKKDVMAAFEAGTDAISATNEAVWYV